MPVTSLNESSWSDVHAIQRAAYTELLHEDVDVLKSKWLASPETCFQFQDDSGKTVSYFLTHPWHLNSAPKLHDVIPEDCSGQQLFLHDLAVSPDVAGQGIGKQMVEAFFERAKALGYSRFMLVAVQGSVPFWSRYGFQVTDEKVSESYGPNAKLMILEFK